MEYPLCKMCARGVKLGDSTANYADSWDEHTCLQGLDLHPLDTSDFPLADLQHLVHIDPPHPTGYDTEVLVLTKSSEGPTPPPTMVPKGNLEGVGHENIIRVDNAMEIVLKTATGMSATQASYLELALTKFVPDPLYPKLLQGWKEWFAVINARRVTSIALDDATRGGNKRKLDRNWEALEDRLTKFHNPPRPPKVLAPKARIRPYLVQHAGSRRAQKQVQFAQTGVKK